MDDVRLMRADKMNALDDAMYGARAARFHETDLPAHIPAEKIAGITDQERQLLERDS
jgi:hypothetical protein